jgi:mRNA interferase MazF
MVLGSDVTPARRGDVVVADFRDAQGREIKRARPVLIVSPDDLNGLLRTYLVVPMTMGAYPYRYRIPCRFREKTGHLILDQLGSIDVRRVSAPIGKLAPATVRQTLATLREMFEE